MNAKIASVPEREQIQTDDERAVRTLVNALLVRGKLDALGAALGSWAEAMFHRKPPARAIAALCFELASRASHDEASKLCRAALDHFPGHGAALELLEEIAELTDTRELCARYAAFIKHAPDDPRAPHLRVRIIDRLVALGLYEAAHKELGRSSDRSRDDTVETTYEDNPLIRTQVLDLSDVDFVDDEPEQAPAARRNDCSPSCA